MKNRLALPALLPLLLLLAAPLAAQPPDYTPIDLAQVASVVGPPQGQRLTGEALEVEAKSVSAVLRCPVCQGLSVGDSPSTMATHMRQQVRELVAAGFVEEQVLSYFEASYGEFVRLKPPLRGVNWFVWLAPAAGLALGIGIVVWVLRGAGSDRGGSSQTNELSERSQLAERDADAVASPAGRSETEAPPPGRDALPADPVLAQAVLKVREAAYGWPGGRRPEAG